MASLPPPSPSASPPPPPSAQPDPDTQYLQQQRHQHPPNPPPTVFDEYVRNPKRLQRFGKKDIAKPRRKIFDPWTTSSTGHQRADNHLARSTAWRDSRTLKLSHQLADTSGSGGKRISDTVGAGSTAFGKDGRLENGGWARGASGLRKNGQLSIQECLARSKAKNTVPTASKASVQRDWPSSKPDFSTHTLGIEPEAATPAAKEGPETVAEKQQIPIFRNLTFYINGSTYPYISDHKLKQLLRQHGGNLALGLGRRTVTHVLIGKPSDASTHSGAGGGLAAGKIDKEIRTVRGKGVKYVSAAWVVDSINAGKRLSEEPYTCLKLAPKGQRSASEVYREKREDESWWDWL